MKNNGNGSAWFYKLIAPALGGLLIFVVGWGINRIVSSQDEQGKDMKLLLPLVERVDAVVKSQDAMKLEMRANQESVLRLNTTVSELKGFQEGLKRDPSK